MGFRISTNVQSINAQRNLSNSQRKIAKSFQQLSSGSRINRSSDDAAGLAISENLRAFSRSYKQANRNANDGISMIQTAEGGMNEIGNIIIRLRELGMQAASDTVGNRERGLIQKEVSQLKNEIQRISTTTTWGSTPLLDGSTPTYDFQVGLFNRDFEDRISYVAGESDSQLSSLGLDSLDYSEKDGAQIALTALDDAQTKVNDMRANLGALQNRLVSTIDNLAVSHENMEAANSRIRDTDVAEATTESTRNNILLQAATATLAQANQTKAQAIRLIG